MLQNFEAHLLELKGKYKCGEAKTYHVTFGEFEDIIKKEFQAAGLVDI